MRYDLNVIGKRRGRRIAFLSVLAVMLLSVIVLMFVNTGDEVSGADSTQEVVGKINYEVIMNGGVETDTVMVIALPNGEKYQGEINIPAKVTFSNDVIYNVMKIGENAFYECYALSSVDIPDSVVTIGNYAFYCCYALSSVDIPDSVVTIGSSAFQSCTVLTSINIPDGVKTISANVFFDCFSLASVEIPDSVETIDDGAFFSCNVLASVVIPDNVETIGKSAFQYCRTLSSVVIPDSVENVGVDAFLHCPALKTVTIRGDGVDSTTAVLKLFEKDGWIIYTDTTVDVLVIDTPAAFNLGNINIPDGKMLEFTSNAKNTTGGSFFKADGTTLLTTSNERSGKTFIKNSLNSWKVGEIIFEPGFTSEDVAGGVLIKMDAGFKGYKGPVTIPSTYSGKKVVGIADDGFEDCRGITSVVIPDNVVTIGASAFAGCSALTSVDIPNSVEMIKDWAFNSCVSLSSVVIPDKVTAIGIGAFNNCLTLTSVVIPNSVKTIDDGAFDSCISLSSVTISALGDGDGGVLSKYFKERSWKLEGSPEITTLTIDTSDKIDIGSIGTPEKKTLILSKKATNTIGQEGKMFCNGIEVTGKERAGKTYTAIEGNWISYAEYDVKLTTNSDEYGSVRGSGTYAYGSNVTIKAIPKDGYQFISWSDGNTSATRNLTITSDVSLKATFADTSAVVYVVNITIEGKGQVYVTGTFEEGSVVTLYAVAENGHSFQKWSHTSSTSTLVSFQLFADMNITATFSSDSAFGGNGGGISINNTTAMIIIIIVVAALALLIVMVVIRGKAR